MAQTRSALSCDCRPDRRRRLTILAGTIVAGALGTAGGFGLVGAFGAPAAQAQDLIEYALMHALMGLF